MVYDKLGWIKINKDLDVYSISDDITMLFEWGVYLIKSISPMYYVLITIGLFFIIVVGVAAKIYKISDRFFSHVRGEGGKT